MLISAWFHPDPEAGFGPGHLRRVEIPVLPRVGDRIESAELNPMFWQARQPPTLFENLNLYLVCEVPEVFVDSSWVVTGVEWVDMLRPHVEVAVVPVEMAAAPGKPMWAFVTEHRLEQESGPADYEQP